MFCFFLVEISVVCLLNYNWLKVFVIKLIEEINENLFLSDYYYGIRKEKNRVSNINFTKHMEILYSTIVSTSIVITIIVLLLLSLCFPQMHLSKTLYFKKQYLMEGSNSRAQIDSHIHTHKKIIMIIIIYHRATSIFQELY